MRGDQSLVRVYQSRFIQKHGPNKVFIISPKFKKSFNFNLNYTPINPRKKKEIKRKKTLN